jgi:trehalose-6-phosphatase
VEARRLVGVGGIAYAGAHGAELIGPGASAPEVAPAFASWRGRVRTFAAQRDESAAMYGGDDATDLDGFAALDELVGSGDLEAAVRVGVRSDEGPSAIVERADLVVDGVEGFVQVLDTLAGA